MYFITMRMISAIEVKGCLYKYPGVTYQTDAGMLLCFQGGSHQWTGMYPGCSWDEFYHDLTELNIELMTPEVAEYRSMYPLLMWPFKAIGVCQRPVCKQETESKYCSLECWYFETLRTIEQAVRNASDLNTVDANSRFMERLIAKYESLVQLSCNAHSAS